MNSRLAVALIATATLGLAAPSPSFAAKSGAGSLTMKPAVREAKPERRALVSPPTLAARAPQTADPTVAPPSLATSRVLDWVSSAKDNGALPYIIIDKQNAELFLFDATGQPLGRAPVLIGVGVGDVSTPGVGSKVLARIGPAERTTPAGRFVARYGAAAGGERVLWVDYADSVALHAVITSNPRERRLQRLRSETAEDNRITFGCINVPTTFYQRRISPLFRKKGGIVYILPDTRRVEEVFPRLLVQPYLAREAR